MFKAVSPRIDIQKVEQEVLDFWRVNHIFERTMEEREDAPRFVFYEGPPTANGTPGSHHVLARAFKDIFPRYKTMRQSLPVQHLPLSCCLGILAVSAPVAQRIEQRFPKPCAGGSTPSWGAEQNMADGVS